MYLNTDSTAEDAKDADACGMVAKFFNFNHGGHGEKKYGATANTDF